MHNTLERITPDLIQHHQELEKEALDLHMERYAFALKHLTSGNILDIACGVGYGTYYLAGNAAPSAAVLGVDNSQAALAYAQARYAHERIHFIQHDALCFSPDIIVHNIVSLETIEHLRYPAAFVKNMSALLPKGGRFTMSVPITPSMDINPFHLNDFTQDKIIRLFENNGCTLVDSFVQEQRYTLSDFIKGNKEKYSLDKKHMFSFYLKHPHKVLTRVLSLFKDGLSNKYLVASFEKK